MTCYKSFPVGNRTSSTSCPLRKKRNFKFYTTTFARFVSSTMLEIPLIWRYYHDINNDEHTSWRRRARHILVQILFVFGRYYALLYLVLLLSVRCPPSFSRRAYYHGILVNSHQGLSVSLCVPIWTGFAVANHFTPKAAKPYFYYFLIGGELPYTTLVNIILGDPS
ncbi:hypothetical protein F5141DRAFT_829050 [Pisolithus sp. B1]|nr:hypothetical protein F5141DRAFT_829050 [Pisolithus sp. B1]